MTYLINLKLNQILKNSVVFGRIFIAIKLSCTLKIFICNIKNGVKHIKYRENPKKIYRTSTLDDKFSFGCYRATNPIKKQTP